MTTKEQKFIKESFKNGFSRMFDNANDANEMHGLLDRYGVKHEVDGQSIRVLEVRKLQDLILSPADEDNPVKDLEHLAGRDTENAQADASENASKLASKLASGEENAPAADPVHTAKKTTRKRKKVTL